MKYLLFAIVIFFAPSYASAQDVPQTGKQFLVGGSFSYSHTVDPITFNSQTSGIFYRERIIDVFSINPYFAKILNNRWTIGMTVGYSHSNNKTEGEVTQLDVFRPSKTTFNRVSTSVFGRFTMNPQNRINIFLRPNVEYAFQKSLSERDDIKFSENKISTVSAGIGLGVLYQLSNRINLSASIGDLAYKYGVINNLLYEDIKNLNFTQLDVNFNLSTWQFGLEYKL